MYERKLLETRNMLLLLLQMKIQTHTVAFRVIHVAILRWPRGSDNLRGSHVRYFLGREQRRQRRMLVAETRVVIIGGAIRDSPKR